MYCVTEHEFYYYEEVAKGFECIEPFEDTGPHECGVEGHDIVGEVFVDFVRGKKTDKADCNGDNEDGVCDPIYPVPERECCRGFTVAPDEF